MDNQSNTYQPQDDQPQPLPVDPPDSQPEPIGSDAATGNTHPSLESARQAVAEAHQALPANPPVETNPDGAAVNEPFPTNVAGGTPAAPVTSQDSVQTFHVPSMPTADTENAAPLNNEPTATINGTFAQPQDNQTDGVAGTFPQVQPIPTEGGGISTVTPAMSATVNGPDTQPPAIQSFRRNTPDGGEPASRQVADENAADTLEGETQNQVQVSPTITPPVNNLAPVQTYDEATTASIPPNDTIQATNPDLLSTPEAAQSATTPTTQLPESINDPAQSTQQDRLMPDSVQPSPEKEVPAQNLSNNNSASIPTDSLETGGPAPPEPHTPKSIDNETSHLTPAFGANTIGLGANIPQPDPTPPVPEAEVDSTTSDTLNNSSELKLEPPTKTQPVVNEMTQVEQASSMTPAQSQNTFQLPTQPTIQPASPPATADNVPVSRLDEPIAAPQTDTAANSFKAKAVKAAGTIKTINYRPFLSAAIVGVIFFGVFNSQVILGQVQYLTTPSGGLDAPTGSIDAQAPVGEENKILIPRINVDVPVVYDVTTFDEEAVQAGLERGVVHYGNTAMPGEIGNNVIVGHSSHNWWDSGKYKFAFILLDKLEEGDQIILHYDETRYVYEVTDSFIVNPTDVSVLKQGDESILTLITCTPPGTSWQRLIVQAKQISPDPKENTDSSKPVSEIEKLPSDSSGGFFNFLRGLF